MATSKTTFNIYSYSMRFNGVPLARVTIGGKHFNFLVSTDEVFNAITFEVWREIQKECSVCATEHIVYDGDSLVTLIAEVPFECKKIEYLEKFAVVPDLSKVQNMTNYTFFSCHGILSSRFLLKHKWVIDYGKRRIYAYKAKKTKSSRK